MSCSCQELVDAWERQGAGAELPPELKERMANCAECSARVEEILSMRALVANLAAPPLSDESVSRMRARLVTRAQELADDRSTESERGDVSKSTPHTPAKPWTWAAMAAAALLLVGFGFALRWWTAPTAPNPPTNPKTAQTQHSPTHKQAGFWIAEGDAQLEALSAAPNEVVWLHHGVVWFKVNPLPKGSVFRVIAGDSEVEVVGTRFRVGVERGRLQFVQVAEGRVIVRSQGQVSADLTAGQQWDSPEFAKADTKPKAPQNDDVLRLDTAPERSQTPIVAKSAPDRPQAKAPRQREPRLLSAQAKKGSAQRKPPYGAEGDERGGVRKKTKPVERPDTLQEDAASRERAPVDSAPRNAIERPDAAPKDTAPGERSLDGPEEPGVAPLKPPKVQPKSVDERFAEAWSLYQAKRFEAAARSFESASNIPQQDSARRAEILYWAARAHLQSGSSDQAARHLKRSLELSPQGWWADDARRLLKTLTPSNP